MTVVIFREPAAKWGHLCEFYENDIIMSLSENPQECPPLDNYDNLVIIFHMDCYFINHIGLRNRILIYFWLWRESKPKEDVNNSSCAIKV